MRITMIPAMAPAMAMVLLLGGCLARADDDCAAKVAGNFFDCFPGGRPLALAEGELEPVEDAVDLEPPAEDPPAAADGDPLAADPITARTGSAPDRSPRRGR